MIEGRIGHDYVRVFLFCRREGFPYHLQAGSVCICKCRKFQNMHADLNIASGSIYLVL